MPGIGSQTAVKDLVKVINLFLLVFVDFLLFRVVSLPGYLV